MIIDARSYDPPSSSTECDVCIVGAGPAGITVALELADTGRSVCLLESGGWGYDKTVQRFNEGRVSGNPYPRLRDTRLSAFGGSTKLWAGWCRPLDAIDFEERSWVANSGWPFGLDELRPHYERAHEVCRLGRFEYDPLFWRERAEAEPLPVDDGTVRTTVFHVNPLSFGDTYRKGFEASQAVRVLLYASALRLHLAETGEAIESVSVGSVGGATFHVKARYFVLAAGGIENARILLLSADTPRRSIGNEHDLVGRYFTEHAFVHPGYFVPADPHRSMAFYFPMEFDGMPAGASVRAGMSLSRATLEEEQLLNAAFVMRPAHEAHPVFDSPEVGAMLELWEKLRGRSVPGRAMAELGLAARAPHRLALAAWRKLTVRGSTASRWGLRAFLEGESLPSNRITLGEERDALGRPRPHIEWHLTDLDIRSVRRGFRLVDRALREAGVGHLELRFQDDEESWHAATFGGKHHMGTTRMHESPHKGVVDADGKVHRFPNLFIAGSSVFPTAGFVNPTLTIVALSARLGAHLRRLVERPAAAGSE